MGSPRRVGLLLAAWLLAHACGSQAYGQLREPPELLVRLWPFFQVRRPVALLPPGAKPERQRLIAPLLVPKIDINHCRLEDLQDLPGVGPSMGAHIMAGRPFRNADDLRRIGVPLNVVNRIRPLIKFGP